MQWQGQASSNTGGAAVKSEQETTLTIEPAKQ